MKIHSARGRGAAAIATLALVGGTASLTTAPAQSAAVEGDCTAPYPLAEVADGDAVDGLTVSEGTTPEGFTGEILGTINDGIAPGLDMVMARLTSPEIDRVGIWQGMSGSPVYAEDGRLIGAVAYGLSWGPSPVAGITPFEDMDDYLNGEAPEKVAVDARAARAIARDSDVSAAQARQGFSQLPMPLAYAGVSGKRLAQARKTGPDYLRTRGATASGAAGSAAVDAGPDDLVAGGNLGAAISYGDITLGGVGTVTSVCDDRLVGFGHPFTYGGDTTHGLMPADAVYVQEDPVGPGFKVANIAPPAGTIDQDRLTGISGPLGVLPPETDVTSSLDYRSRSRTGTTASFSEDYDATVVFFQLLANHDRVIDAIQPGSEVATHTVTGTDSAGEAFEISFTERYTSSYDIAFEAIWDIADIVYSLSRMNGVDVADVEVSGEVTDATGVRRVGPLEYRRGGEWVDLGRRSKVFVQPGGVLRLRVTLKGPGDDILVPMNLDVPAKAKRRGYLEVVGGASSWSSAIYRAKTPAQIEEALENSVRNDEVRATLEFAARGKNPSVTEISEPQDLVVRGGEYVSVRVIEEAVPES